MLILAWSTRKADQGQTSIKDKSKKLDPSGRSYGTQGSHTRSCREVSSWLEGSLPLATTLKTILRRGDFSSWLWQGPPAWLGQLTSSLPLSPIAAIFLLLCLVYIYHKVFGGRVGLGTCFLGFAEPWLWFTGAAGYNPKVCLADKL